jgi:hypothetical protein
MAVKHIKDNKDNKKEISKEMEEAQKRLFPDSLGKEVLNKCLPKNKEII